MAEPTDYAPRGVSSVIELHGEAAKTIGGSPIKSSPQLNVRRAYKEGDSRLVSPLEQLKDLVREIEAGERNPDQLFVAMLTFDKKKPGRWRTNYVCAGVTLRDIIALLEIMKDRVLHDG